VAFSLHRNFDEENLKEIDHLEDFRSDFMIILKRIQRNGIGGR
jgi:hypothetical protein